LHKGWRRLQIHHLVSLAEKGLDARVPFFVTLFPLRSRMSDR
jgi:hypothetical protein